MSLYKRAKLYLFAIFIGFSSIGFSANGNFLQQDDIKGIMQQILDQHIAKKEVSPAILLKSFSIYIDQFDPERIYLLEKEVQPFLAPSDKQLNLYLKQYRQGDFSSYERLNLFIRTAIERARQWRSTLPEESKHLFETALQHRPYRQWGERNDIGFAKDFHELKKRMHRDVMDYIEEQKARFGANRVMSYQERVLQLYENEMRTHENQYLPYEEGRVLTEEEQEHRFVLHVMKALAKSLDSHTRFFNDSEAYDMRVRLEKGYEGTGIIFEEGLEGPRVVSLIPNSPAKKNGKIQNHDILISIDEMSIERLPFEEVMKKLRGNAGTYVKLTFKRHPEQKNKEIFQVKLMREKLTIEMDRVETAFENFGDGIIGSISLRSFYQNKNGISSEKDVWDAIRYLRQQGPLRGLILDLRDNSGGYLSQAVKVAGLFITNGIVVISKYQNGEVRYYRDLDERVFYDGPLVVLTSRGTASAAEIVAQALQDYGVALVVGDQYTYGKGSIQSQTVTDEKSASFFKVTVGKYYTVSGKTPQIRGVEADIVVPTQFVYGHVGEEFLEYPLSQDSIHPEYKDQLKDIHPEIQGWFLKYYLPTLQVKTTKWKEMLPILKKNSAYRLAHNRDYQSFFKSLEAEETQDPLGKQVYNNQLDMQFLEAVSILKDMFLLQSDLNEDFVGIPNRNP